jgi:ubiquitin-activating enzyme E1
LSSQIAFLNDKVLRAHSQVVIPHVTESYSASADPEEDAIPLCTIKTFPTQVSY